MKEYDRLLPIANVGRVMRNCMPPQAMLSREAKECVLQCCTEFIAFITSEAMDKCNMEKRKCITGEDILLSMYSLGFEGYAEMLRIYLVKYREYEFRKTEKDMIKTKDDVEDDENDKSSIEDYLEWDDS